jgi:hypothetical protein
MGATRRAETASIDDGSRAKIVERVRALLAMNTENGCTEAEAMTAADMAGRMMQQYDLTIEDIEALKREAVEPQARPFGKTQRSPELHPAAKHCSVAVAAFFDCRVWRSGTEIVFLGLNDDVELAHDMLAMIRGAMDRDVKVFRKAGGVNDGTSLQVQSTSYLLGMGTRISERLLAVKVTRSAAAKGRGVDLVVVKADLVADAFDKYFDTTRSRKSYFQRDPGSSAAYGIGYETGDRLALSKGEIARPAFDKRTPAERARAASEAARNGVSQARWHPTVEDAPKPLSLCKEATDLLLFVAYQAWVGTCFVVPIVFACMWLGVIPDLRPAWTGADELSHLVVFLAGGLVWACLVMLLRTMTHLPGGATVGLAQAMGLAAGVIAHGLRRR